MELLFLGRGAAFNPIEGSNSAFFIDKDELFLIDCGESIFYSILENNILENIKKINLLITHTHSDHVGSLGSLIMYAYYNLKIPVNIILPHKALHKEKIEMVLRGFGCSDNMYSYVLEENFDRKYSLFDTIRYSLTDHCDNLNCYSILFETCNGIIYYSGDTREVDTLNKLINNCEIDKIYIDTTTVDYPGNAHLYIGLLNEVIPSELKSKVYCMHINNNLIFDKALEYGFNVVKMYKKRDY